MTVYIAQAIGFFGLLFAAISFQKNDNKGILFFQIAGALTFTLHFSLLGAYTGAAMNLMGAARNFVFYHRDKKWADKKYWLYLFIAIYIVSGLLTWKNIFSIFPIAAMTLGSIGLWIKNPRYTRLVVLPSSPCWLIYNVANLSVAGILTEIFVSSSLIIAIIRFDILKLPDRSRQKAA